MEWTEEKLQKLPEGLGGAYKLMMNKIMESLDQYCNENGMRELLTKRMLPVLAAARGLLPVDVLARACSNDVSSEKELETVSADVKEILPLISSMFRTSTSSSGQQLVQPYHKTVLDWLTCTGGMDAGEELKADVAEGHRRLGQAGECLLSNQHPTLPSYTDKAVSNMKLEVESHEDASHENESHEERAMKGERFVIIAHHVY
jgi:hypothetical protein